jgi:hypothetical protein
MDRPLAGGLAGKLQMGRVNNPLAHSAREILVSRMHSIPSSRIETDAPPGAWQRWLLALAAAVSVAAVGWAGVQVQQAKSDVEKLKEDLAASQRNERAAAAAAQAVPKADNSSRLATVERALADAEKAQKQAAAHEKELNDVIVFLRSENTAAQETIKRLSAPPAEPAPAVDPAAGATPAPAPAPPPEPEPKKRNRRR